MTCRHFDHKSLSWFYKELRAGRDPSVECDAGGINHAWEKDLAKSMRYQDRVAATWAHDVDDKGLLIF